MATPKIGDRVTFYFWTNAREASGDAPAVEARLHATSATITHVFDLAVGTPQGLALEVDFPAGIAEREGWTTAQTYSLMRARVEDDIFASGTWSIP